MKCIRCSVADAVAMNGWENVVEIPLESYGEVYVAITPGVDDPDASFRYERKSWRLVLSAMSGHTFSAGCYFDCMSFHLGVGYPRKVSQSDVEWLEHYL